MVCRFFRKFAFGGVLGAIGRRSTRTSCDDTLIYIELAVFEFLVSRFCEIVPAFASFATAFANLAPVSAKLHLPRLLPAHPPRTCVALLSRALASPALHAPSSPEIALLPRASFTLLPHPNVNKNSCLAVSGVFHRKCPVF